MKIDVLNHGYVRLIDHMGGDLSVARAARNSYDAAWRAGLDEGSDAKLIRYLWKHHHSTPFEVVTFTFEVCAPIFVFRQWHRHRTWSYNEMSARYTELPTVYYVPEVKNIGEQSKTNKQGRQVGGDDLNRRLLQLKEYLEAVEKSFEVYRDLINDGWPRELARCVLPVATYSRMFATVNLWNLFHFLTLRADPHAQHEIRVYAEAIIELIAPIAPECVAAWKSTRHAGV